MSAKHGRVSGEIPAKLDVTGREVGRPAASREWPHVLVRIQSSADKALPLIVISEKQAWLGRRVLASHTCHPMRSVMWCHAAGQRTLFTSMALRWVAVEEALKTLKGDLGRSSIESRRIFLSPSLLTAYT